MILQEWCLWFYLYKNYSWLPLTHLNFPIQKLKKWELLLSTMNLTPTFPQNRLSKLPVQHALGYRWWCLNLNNTELRSQAKRIVILKLLCLRINASSRATGTPSNCSKSHQGKCAHVNRWDFKNCNSWVALDITKGNIQNIQGSVPTVCAVVGNSYTTQLFCSWMLHTILMM